MKHPERLLQSGSPRARELLASLAEDVPPDPAAGAERVLRALDLPVSGTPRSSGSLSLATRRYFPLAAIVVGVIGVTSFATLIESRPSSSDVAAGPVAQTFEPAVVTPQAPLDVAPAPEAIDDIAAASSPSVDVHALATAPSPAPRAPGSVRTARGAPAVTTNAPAPARETPDELRLLERAQTAAARGRPDEALALVAEHRREFPQGTFSMEMSVIEVEALARAGRVEEAARRGERLLESHPASPYARRVEAVIRLRDRKDLPR